MCAAGPKRDRDGIGLGRPWGTEGGRGGDGADGWSVDPAFAVERLPLIERGFVYAIAHVRGGSEKGQGWYRAGKLENRTNAFADFLSAAEALVAAGYTRRGRIVAH